MQQIVLPIKDSNVLKEVQDILYITLKLVDVITPFSSWHNLQINLKMYLLLLNLLGSIPQEPKYS